MISIRSMTAADLPAVAALFDAYRQFYEQPADRGLATAYLVARQASGESVVLVATDESDAVVAFCQLYPTFCSVEAQAIYVLYDLFVAPSARRRGVAAALMQAAAARGRADGKSRLDLSTARTNSDAQALYESLGWIRDEVYFTYSLAL